MKGFVPGDLTILVGVPKVQRKVSTIAQWIDNGRLLEGNEPFFRQEERSDFFSGILRALVALGWMPDTVTDKALYEECLFKKGSMQYRFSLMDERGYKFKREA